MTKTNMLEQLHARGIALPSEVADDLPDADGIPGDDQAGDIDADQVARVAAKVKRLLGESDE